MSILPRGVRLVPSASGGRMLVVKILTLGKPASTNSWNRAMESGELLLR